MEYFNIITSSFIYTVLKQLLADKTTGKNIIFATDEYAQLGIEYTKKNKITVLSLKNIDFYLQPRALKNKSNQVERTKQRAEVFTPLSTCCFMNDFYDKSVTIKNKNWVAYIHSTVLEITCGEAPFIASRYDAVEGNAIELKKRIGLLDRKLFIVTKNFASEQEWLTNAFDALRSVYGYEFAGDSLLIARINVLVTFADHFKNTFNKELSADELSKAAEIISWNFWQMDGLTKTIPFGNTQQEDTTLFLFAEMQEPVDNKTQACKIKDWQKNKIIDFSKIKGSKTMKFDFVIGNPPYQDLTLGENATFAPPIYNVFIDSAFKVANKVELIHPARFLFNAGSTPKAWNQKMLKDEHLKVLYYEQN